MNKNYPRCSNKNIQEGYKYCPICGFKLGTALEVPVQEQSIKRLLPMILSIIGVILVIIGIILKN